MIKGILMSWTKMCKKLCCCKRKAPESEPPTRVEVSIARHGPPAHRYTDTVANILDTLNEPPPRLNT